MLKPVTHIEGYEGLEIQDDLPNDTNPNSVQVRFDVKSEEMPALSAAAGRVIRQNFIHITCVWELGRTSFTRRIRDKVEFDEKTNKWKIKMFAPGGLSDIRAWTTEWNAFMNGAAEQDFGTPLQFMFKNDPSRVEIYKRLGIGTIDRLAGLNDSDADSIGMGGRDDVRRAREFIARAKQAAPQIELNNRLEEKDHQIEKLQATINDLTEKLTELLQRDIKEASPAKKRGRPKKIIETETEIEGV